MSMSDTIRGAVGALIRPLSRPFRANFEARLLPFRDRLDQVETHSRVLETRSQAHDTRTQALETHAHASRRGPKRSTSGPKRSRHGPRRSATHYPKRSTHALKRSKRGPKRSKQGSATSMRDFASTCRLSSTPSQLSARSVMNWRAIATRPRRPSPTSRKRFKAGPAHMPRSSTNMDVRSANYGLVSNSFVVSCYTR